MKVTVKQVAEHAGTSVATVSRYLNQSGYVSKNIGAKIDNAIKELEYKPKGLARIFLDQSHQNIGILIPDLNNMFYPQVVMGLEDELQRNSYSAFLCITYDSVENEISYLHTLLEKRVDAFVFVGGRPKDANNNHITSLAKKFPVVLLNDYLLGASTFSIMSDEVDGAYTAVRYLQSLGHTEIAFINGDQEFTTFRLKESGYRRAMEEGQIPIRSDLVITTNPTASGGYQVAMGIFSKEQCPSAIFAASDEIAIGILRAATESGISIPKDLSVIGFSNIPVSAELCPPLTTIDQQPYELGKIAAETVIRVLNDEPLKQKRILLQSQLMKRATCAPLSAEEV